MERWVFAVVLATTGMFAASPLAADDYPSRPIRFLHAKAETARWNRVIDTAGIARQ